MEIKAFAKINLALYVTSKREDGFHNIETIFIQTDLFDTLIIKENKELIVTCSNAEIPGGKENIVYQAAQKLREAFNIRDGALIHIDKKIPHGGGLGGGSADAASAVKGLIKLWGIKDKEDLVKGVLESAGSDVPFCFLGGAAFGSGRGEILESVPILSGYDIVLVNPGIHISTKKAYESLRIKLTGRGEKVNLINRYKDLLDCKLTIKDFVHNDFEAFAEKQHPEIALLKSKLYEYGAKAALMSGSGSTVFGLFTKGSIGKELERELKKEVDSLFVTTINGN